MSEKFEIKEALSSSSMYGQVMLDMLGDLIKPFAITAASTVEVEMRINGHEVSPRAYFERLEKCFEAEVQNKAVSLMTGPLHEKIDSLKDLLNKAEEEIGFKIRREFPEAFRDA